MAKGKSNPKTLEHVKRMTKQMRSEQAEAQALEAATQAAQAVDRKRSKNKKGRRGDVSSDDDENDDPSATQAAAAANGGKKGTGSQSKVQVAGFGIGCRGTGNEKARKLKDSVEKIRRDYFAKMKKGDPLEQQLAVTTYLVDKLALRAGGEKDEDLADTVGVCTLRVGHVEFMPPSTLKFDFLGKDSIRYLQEHEVDPLVFAAMSKFCKGKKPEHDIFDKIDPTKVNKHLQSLMPGLTIKVFRTYNASYVLNKLLRDETPDGTVLQKKAAYDAANKEVAVLCNHQKGVSKAHDAQMEKLEDKRKAMAKELASLRKEKLDKNKGKIATLKERLAKLELNIKMKDELKTVSLGTSKINYLDPRITIAWCKRHEVPPPTVFTRALIEKFNWSMEVEPTFDF